MSIPEFDSMEPRAPIGEIVRRPDLVARLNAIAGGARLKPTNQGGK